MKCFENVHKAYCIDGATGWEDDATSSFPPELGFALGWEKVFKYMYLKRAAVNRLKKSV